MKVTGEPETRSGYAMYRALATAKHVLQPAGDTEGSAEFIRGELERVVHNGLQIIQRSEQMTSPDRACGTRPPPTDVACISPGRSMRLSRPT